MKNKKPSYRKHYRMGMKDIQRQAHVLDEAMKLDEKLKKVPMPTVANIPPKLMEATILSLVSVFSKGTDKKIAETVANMRLMEYVAELGATGKKSRK